MAQQPRIKTSRRWTQQPRRKTPILPAPRFGADLFQYTSQYVPNEPAELNLDPNKIRGMELFEKVHPEIVRTILSRVFRFLLDKCLISELDEGAITLREVHTDEVPFLRDECRVTAVFTINPVGILRNYFEVRDDVYKRFYITIPVTREMMRGYGML